MATSQAQLPLQSGAWTDTFPETQVTQQQSTAFVKKLLAIAVSNIAYMRVLFPDKAFSDRCLEGLNLKILKNDKAYPPVVEMVDWLKGVFDALDKKYLRMLVLGFHRNSTDPNTLLEMYTFKFSYTDATEIEVYSGDRKVSTASTAGQTKKATISLLRNMIVLIETLKPLPEDARVTMKLFYYDNVTPENYEPPGFREAETDFICMEGNPTKFRFQGVTTPFHSMQLRVIADATMDDEDEAVSEQVNQEKEMTEDAVRGTDVEVDDSQSVQEGVVNSTTPDLRGNAAHSQASAAAGDGSICGDVRPPGVSVRCPCLANDDDLLMIQCSVCRYWQHAICFKILDDSLAPARHVCHLCCSSAAEPTDAELAGVEQSEAQMICLWRRSLAACLEVSRISSPQLASRLGVASSVASCLVDRLVSEGYASSKGKLARKLIQKRKIKREALVKYFTKNNESAMETE